MLSNAALCGYKDRELQALKHELDVEVLNNSNSINAEFHDYEDLVYDCRTGAANCRDIRSELLNVCGGEFLHE